MLTKATRYCAENAFNRGSCFVFSLTSITGETDKCDSPFTNTPAEEELASVQKNNQKDRFVGHQELEKYRQMPLTRLGLIQLPKGFWMDLLNRGDYIRGGR